MGNCGGLHCYTSVRSRAPIVPASSPLVPDRSRCQVFTNIYRVDYSCKPLGVLHPTPSARHMICLTIPEWSGPAAQLEEGEHATDDHDHQGGGEDGDGVTRPPGWAGAECAGGVDRRGAAIATLRWSRTGRFCWCHCRITGLCRPADAMRPSPEMHARDTALSVVDAEGVDW